MSRYLAIDWDQKQLHLIAADIRGGHVTFRRAAVWHEEKSPLESDAEAVGRLLRGRLREAGITPAPVLACIGRDRLILKEVRYPAVAASEEPALVRFQALKELTDPPDDVVLDYTPIGESGGERRALAIALRKELLEAYQKICQAAGLKLAGLTPRIFGVAAAAGAPADRPSALVAQGENWAEFGVVRGEQVYLARTVTPGSGLAGEVRRNLAVFAGQSPGQAVEKVYYAGDGPLPARLIDTLQGQVEPFDPFGGATGDALPTGERGSFAGAAGLLLAKARSPLLPINFVQPRQPAPPPRFPLLKAAVIAAGLLIVLGGAAAYGRSFILQLRKENEALQEDIEVANSQLTKLQQDDRFLRGLDGWEGPVWLDELYEIASCVGDVNALRISQLKGEPPTRTAGHNTAARLTIKGNMQSNDRSPLDKFLAELRKAGFYSPEAAKVNGNNFELTVNIDRRAPADHKRRLTGGQES